MKYSLFVIAGVLASGAAHAGAIDSACMKYAGRASAATCGCIQQVADSTLSRSDQRRAAGFFKNPDKAQDVRMSPSQSDNDFWARYKTFAQTAEAYCAR
ncbi:hypothetical protein [Paenirhodobacter sp.]|uniref:hypothetical protein n=1 Tax=Paenirhodobacter sp. TaxID=1965326 RepID=UPI003B405118